MQLKWHSGPKGGDFAGALGFTDARVLLFQLNP